MNPRDMFKLLLLAAIWGASFLLIRIAAPVLGPVGLVTARMLIASTVLWLYAHATGRRLPALRSEWRTYLTLGALNSAVPLALEAYAVVHLSASLVAILAATTPLFTALAAAVWLGERLTVRRAVGLLVGMSGVAAIVGWSELSLTSTAALALGAALLSAILYAVSGVYVKVAVHHSPALPLTIGRELTAGLLLLPLALAAPQHSDVDALVVAATVTLALVMTAGGTLLYFNLIVRLGPTQTQSVSFLVPGVAVLLGVLLLDEPLTAGMVLGLGLVLASVGLVTDLGGVVWRWSAARLFRHSALRGTRRETLVAQFVGMPSLPTQPAGWVPGVGRGYDRQSTRRPVMQVRDVRAGLHT